jgi:hypothetical protein
MHSLWQPPPVFTPKFFAKSHWPGETISGGLRKVAVHRLTKL